MMNHDSAHLYWLILQTVALNYQAQILLSDAIVWRSILDYTETAKQGVNNRSMFVRQFPVYVQTVTLDLRSACRNRCVTNTKLAQMSRCVDMSGSWRQTGLSVLRRFNWGNQSLHLLPVVQWGACPTGSETVLQSRNKGNPLLLCRIHMLHSILLHTDEQEQESLKQKAACGCKNKWYKHHKCVQDTSFPLSFISFLPGSHVSRTLSADKVGDTVLLVHWCKNTS